jgi:lipoate-protein ligase A
MKWNIIDTGKASAVQNMAIDYALLRELPSTKQPILHLYDWEGDCATYGHFLDPYKYLNRAIIEKQGLQLARRPTGGGIVFHLTDFAYSILIPAYHPAYSVNTLENYAFVHKMIAKIIEQFLDIKRALNLLDIEPVPNHPDAQHFCMAQPTLNDVMWNGKKIGGGAQRRTKHGFLHQGTISLCNPGEDFLNSFLLSKELLESFKRNECIYQKESSLSKMKLKQLLIDEFDKSY